IWAVAAVGMGIGAGHYFASASASVLILIVLAILPYMERMIDRLNQSKEYSIKCDFSANKRVHYELLLKQHNLKYKLSKEIKEGNQLIINWEVRGPAKNHEQFAAVINEDATVNRFEY
ncbi:MAG TPA: hypothetical protein VI548_02980, partial [Chitinophagaceae bacterium]|nr:hypothetical protein [Chitinophagaceae bacterium]